ncbi:MerR family DNA-binding transcriptional regulator [Bacillus nakamurai]|uniref:HTH merR-type domain-containing protein n=1 Tax=Bacillus nakamurai TaxID=1793963 RepID=A0A150FA32_9BACI|nr:MerR family DNA-binding transcriptional regulator [Bacillus nakamurai]KXZ21498.1 hypothetical protein AXI58_11085 [Bacillus nakamurai]MED1229346.1 MerR family DNA-binding transcriptional regulator [Bacillus nakamurai]
MEEKIYTVGEFARLTGVTERTLRYYDQENLLKPAEYEDNGRRLYSHGALFELNKILALKFSGRNKEMHTITGTASNRHIDKA